MVLAGVMAAGLSGCGGPDRVTADDAWIRLPAAPGRPGAAYFTLHGGRSDATLIDVSADVAVRAEIHESMSGAGGMAGMKPLACSQTSTTGARPSGFRHSTGGPSPGARMLLSLADVMRFR